MKLYQIYASRKGREGLTFTPLGDVAGRTRRELLDEEYRANGGDGEDELAVLDLKWLAAMNLDASDAPPTPMRP